MKAGQLTGLILSYGLFLLRAGVADAQLVMRVQKTVAIQGLQLSSSALNNQFDRIVVVTHDYGTAGPYATAPLRIGYAHDGKWYLNAMDGSDIPMGARFNVLVVPPGDNAFRHTADSTNSLAHVTIINHPALNDRPAARPLVMAGSYHNPHNVGVYYTGTRWAIFNQNLDPMPSGAIFHVYVDDRAFDAAATPPVGNTCPVDHPATNGKSNEVVFASQYWTGAYNAHPIGVWYSADKWHVFNEDEAPMPVNARFNLLALKLGDNNIYPPVTARASRYDGVADGYAYAYDPRFNASNAITVEAWVYREGGACETLLSNGFSGPDGSFWLGFCPNLRFYRSGGSFYADATLPVLARKWTHVAASYDGATVRFYINGAAAGVSSLSNAGLGGAHPLWVGVDPDGFPFKGYLDEVRLWRGARTQSQIQQGMWREIRDDPALAAVFDTGGGREVLGDLAGVPQTTAPEVSGLGILPRELRVPLSPLGTLAADGVLDLFGEYAGAERFVIRNHAGVDDESGYLIHDGTRLFVAVENLADPAPSVTDAESIATVYIASNAIGAAVAGPTDLRIRKALDGAGALQQGNGFGGFVAASPDTGWVAALGTPFNEFAAANAEFRMDLFRLYSNVTFTNRFAFIHSGVLSVSDPYPTPGDAVDNWPATWAPMTYLNEIVGSPLGRANYDITVINPDTGEALAGRQVRLFTAAGLTYGTYTTDGDGRIEVNRAVPDLPLRMQVILDFGEQAQTPWVYDDAAGPSPVVLDDVTVEYPACGPGAVCQFDRVFMYVFPPLGAVHGDSAAVDVTAPLQVRDGADPKAHPAGQGMLTGSNFHAQLELFLALQTTTPMDTPLNGLLEGVHYWPVTIMYHGPNFIVFQAPDVPQSARGRAFIPVLRDAWVRPANPALSWHIVPGYVRVNNPPYPQMHGFEFKNIADGHDIDDYRAAFAGQVCNPLTMVGFWAYFPLYLDLLDGGECYGVTMTSQRFAHGALAPASYGLDALFANGLPSVGDRQPVLPAIFNVDNPCAPSPVNLWARIRAYHGTQLSSETIAATLDQFDVDPDLGGLITDMNDALNLLRAHPLNYHLCMHMGDKGHCVQPLRVIEEILDPGTGEPMPLRKAIEIYDSNHPEELRLIQIDLAVNRYTYDGFDPAWTGQWMPLYLTEPLATGEHHIPSLDTLATAIAPLGIRGVYELLQLIVGGDAEPLVTSTNGGQLGWLADGTFVRTSTETWPMPVFNWRDDDVPPLGHYPVTMLHRMTGGVPRVTIHGRGPTYTAHIAHHGGMTRLLVEQAADGEDDELGFLQDGEIVGGLRLTPIGERTLEALIALCRNRTEYPAAFTFNNITVPAAQSIAVRALPGAAGVEFFNDTDLAQDLVLAIHLPAPDTTTPRRVSLPARRVPRHSRFRAFDAGGGSFSNLILEVDLWGDGLPDARWSFSTETGYTEELLPPVLSIARIEPDALKVSWLWRTNWSLRASPNLGGWGVVTGATDDGGIGVFGLPESTPGPQFFRLEQDPP